MNSADSGRRPLIGTGKLTPNSLKGEIAVVTGAGRGIGYEAARSLVWLGAKVVIAEVDNSTGRVAEEKINGEFGEGKAFFCGTDVGDEDSIKRLLAEAHERFGSVDVVLNNATVFPIGAVKDKPVDLWDLSYRVNLRGPVLLARAVLPDMIKKRKGTFVCVSSSGAVPFMGAYEVFKTAQVELANTIAAEVEGTGVYAFTIGPGIVRTPGFLDGGSQVASLMGMNVDELIEMNKAVLISPEAAGAGFAASIALASQFHGQETSSIQALIAAGISIAPKEEEVPIGAIDFKKAADACDKVLTTLRTQVEGFKKRNLFERQWVYRDFKRYMGASPDEVLAKLAKLQVALNTRGGASEYREILNKLSTYYEHLQEQYKGFEKDPAKLEQNLRIMQGWQDELRALMRLMAGQA